MKNRYKISKVTPRDIKGLHKKYHDQRIKTAFLEIKQLKRNEELRFLQNEANFIGECMLECFDYDSGDRKKAMDLLYKNIRPSEFTHKFEVMLWPVTGLRKSLCEKFPFLVKQWMHWVPTTLEDEFHKHEVVIDYLRRRYNLLARAEREGRRRFELSKDKRDK